MKQIHLLFRGTAVALVTALGMSETHATITTQKIQAEQQQAQQAAVTAATTGATAAATAAGQAAGRAAVLTDPTLQSQVAAIINAINARYPGHGIPALNLDGGNLTAVLTAIAGQIDNVYNAGIAAAPPPPPLNAAIITNYDGYSTEA